MNQINNFRTPIKQFLVPRTASQDARMVLNVVINNCVYCFSGFANKVGGFDTVASVFFLFYPFVPLNPSI